MIKLFSVPWTAPRGKDGFQGEDIDITVYLETTPPLNPAKRTSKFEFIVKTSAHDISLTGDNPDQLVKQAVRGLEASYQVEWTSRRRVVVGINREDVKIDTYGVSPDGKVVHVPVAYSYRGDGGRLIIGPPSYDTNKSITVVANDEKEDREICVAIGAVRTLASRWVGLRLRQTFGSAKNLDKEVFLKELEALRAELMSTLKADSAEAEAD